MTIVEEFRQDESRVLDRMVDGELSQADRRTLLTALDDEPGAWRRCALAFIEAQSWRWQLGQVAAEPIVAQAAALARRERTVTWRGKSRGAFWGMCLAAAASLLVSFGLGTRFPTIDRPQIAAAPVRAAVDQGPGAQATGADAVEPKVEPGAESPWETVTLAAADDAGNVDADNQFELRVRDPASSDAGFEELLAGGQSAVPTALVNQLEQQGWRVSRERHLVPVDLADGRRLIVPVEQVDIHQPQIDQY